ncbi:translation initiation factor IF-2-like [Mirounga leonina]|uniref:translation initiation factor IF-2-like n=1 Tax=Mirounga leonina TaxID=9715 RepID=UPI00156C110F|nr:translation initiation factor IF-2-like [Mirounga leonina]
MAELTNGKIIVKSAKPQTMTSPSTPGIICADSTSDRSGERGRPRETGSGASAHGAAPAPPSAAPASPAAGAPPPAPAPPTPASRSRACAASGARVRASRAVCCGVCGFLLRARALKKVLIVVRSSGGEDGDPTSESAGRKETVSREVKADKRSKNPPPIAPRVRSAPGDGVSAPRTPFLIKNSKGTGNMRMVRSRPLSVLWFLASLPAARGFSLVGKFGNALKIHHPVFSSLLVPGCCQVFLDERAEHRENSA